MQGINRRYFFLGSLAFGLSCRRSVQIRQSAPPHRVSIAHAASYSTDLTGIIRNLLVEHCVAIAGKRIVLKPNLVEFNPHAPINTHPIFIAAVEEAFRSLGASDIRIAEGPGHRRMTLDLAAAAGHFAVIPKFERHFTDLNLDDVERVVLNRPFSSLKELYLPKTVLGCDLLVSLPKMKTHHWTGATLSMKNLFGTVPGGVYGWPKNILHWSGINECIADLHYVFPNQFSIVDGIEGMEGNGPILGTKKKSGVIVAGRHAPTVDATCCQIMQIDPAKIGYLRLIAERSGWSPGAAHQIGETIASVSTPFLLMPDFSGLRLL
ncbi:MAG: DUF362 domain-containing protein [Acidobacteriota bacterium]|nr:DUF362 domain-containing protein [Acidobacteriota bacterium]